MATDRPARRPLLVRVDEVERLGPHLIRIVFTGEDLEGFGAGAFTDHYIKLQLPPVGAGYTAPFDVQEIRETLPKEQWPRTRTYTVRRWEAATRRLTVDFVVHGDTGVAGPWAAAARPGDHAQLLGPGGAYAPSPDADWHLMVGDLAVVPAIAASLERVPAGVPVHVVLQVDGPGDEVPLASPGDLQVTWRHGGDDETLAEAVRDLTFPDGDVHAFVHGEAGAVRAVRRHLLGERRVAAEAVSVSGYWKRERTEEGWREDKPAWNAQVEADLAA